MRKNEILEEHHAKKREHWRYYSIAEKETEKEREDEVGKKKLELRKNEILEEHCAK